MFDLKRAMLDAVSALRANGNFAQASELERAVGLLSAEPVAWAVSWREGGVRKLQAFQRREVALSWLDDRRLNNPVLNAARVVPLFAPLD